MSRQKIVSHNANTMSEATTEHMIGLAARIEIVISVGYFTSDTYMKIITSNISDNYAYSYYMLTACQRELTRDI